MTVKRGDIVLVDLPRISGSIQYGKRPCVIVQNDVGNRFSTLTMVVPLTSSKKPVIKTHVCFKQNGVINTALCEQVLTIPKNDIQEVLNKVPGEIMRVIDQKLKLSLGVK